MNSYFKKGKYNAICDRCGFKFKADKLRKNWQGLYLCKKDWEPRNEQDFLRVRAENQGVPWSRPEQEDVFLSICYVWTRSAYAGLGTAGCMQAGNNVLTYSNLLQLKNGT